ncbi:flagellar protein FlgN [Paenibacillus caui]|uniref:flagellar protein FlgN n=1 Tax=Paenibacillus caui TaxID=2873927 RepID=UPI001CA9F44A|nr:flagellar protein FlgN [Paenibacillus caui]
MSVTILSETLDALRESYSELLGTSLEKRKAIVSRNYDELLRTMNVESRKTKAIHELENRLQDGIQLLLREKGVQSHLQLKLSEIMRLVFDPEEKAQLKDKHAALKHTLEELKSVNAFNQELIQQSLSFIDYSLNLMADNWDQELTYAPPQVQDKKPQARSRFDTRA